MNADKNQSLLFANENVIYRIIAVARIVSWVVLVIYLIVLASSVNSILQQQAGLPTQFMDWLTFIANLLYPPALGLFYFLVLQGVAQGLSLGLDTFYGLNPEEEGETAIGLG